MLPALRDSERRFLIQVALMLACGSLSLLPLTAESSSGAAAEIGASALSAAKSIEPESSPIPNISLRRDPFVPDATVAAAASEATARSYGSIGGSLPPNAGASDVSLIGNLGTSGTPIVRAVILGARSKALVEMSGEVQVLGVGDAVGGSAIASVDDRGIVLSSGERILLLERRP